jgi:DNA-binding MarR family transcriptional regulator
MEPPFWIRLLRLTSSLGGFLYFARILVRRAIEILDRVKYFNYHGFMKCEQEVTQKIRSFNRYYTNIIGLLDRHYLDSPFSLTEGRVLYEMYHTEDCTAKKIRANITIDEGYLSRIIDRFIRQGFIKKSPSPDDRRLYIIVLTEKGKREFLKLNDNSDKLICSIIAKLSQTEREELVDMMGRLREMLSKGGVSNPEGIYADTGVTST